ncbi:MAG: hypothetical protein ACLURU_00040 [Finegoldia magna]|nr:hypothetical protein [Finegoldia magna]
MENKPIRFTELSKQINSEFSKLDKESQTKIIEELSTTLLNDADYETFFNQLIDDFQKHDIDFSEQIQNVDQKDRHAFYVAIALQLQTTFKRQNK